MQLKTPPEQEKSISIRKIWKCIGRCLIGWYGNEVHSPALIDWADCVIVIGGSIGIEAMLQNKHVVYPTYLSNHTMYEYYQAAHCLMAFQR